MAIVNAGPVTMRPTNYMYDRFFARGFGTLQKQSLPVIPEEQRAFSVQQFVMNSTLLYSLPEKDRVRAFNIIRRTVNALDEYELGRKSYDAIFEDEHKNTDAYLRALHHFEGCIGQLMQAHELFFGMIEQKYRNKNATGREELNHRLWRIYIAAKHTEDLLLRSQKFQEGDTHSAWISDSGIRSKEAEVKFEELYVVLCDMAGTATMLAGDWRAIREAALQAASEQARESK